MVVDLGQELVDQGGESVDLSSGELTPSLGSVDLSGGVRLWVILVDETSVIAL